MKDIDMELINKMIYVVDSGLSDKVSNYLSDGRKVLVYKIKQQNTLRIDIR